MRREVLFLIARQFWTGVVMSRAIYLSVGLLLVLLLYAAYSGISYHDQNHFREDHQEEARESWEANPCLLYTSPSPRDKRQSRMPSSA